MELEGLLTFEGEGAMTLWITTALAFIAVVTTLTIDLENNWREVIALLMFQAVFTAFISIWKLWKKDGE